MAAISSLDDLRGEGLEVNSFPGLSGDSQPRIAIFQYAVKTSTSTYRQVRPVISRHDNWRDRRRDGAVNNDERGHGCDKSRTLPLSIVK